MNANIDGLTPATRRAWETVKATVIAAETAIVDLRDCVEAWKHHCKHVEHGTPCAVKTIGMDSFDPRLHCDLCAAEWKRRNRAC